MSEYSPCYPLPPCSIMLEQVAVVCSHIFVGDILELVRLCVHIYMDIYAGDIYCVVLLLYY